MFPTIVVAGALAAEPFAQEATWTSDCDAGGAEACEQLAAAAADQWARSLAERLAQDPQYGGVSSSAGARADLAAWALGRLCALHPGPACLATMPAACHDGDWVSCRAALDALGAGSLRWSEWRTFPMADGVGFTPAGVPWTIRCGVFTGGPDGAPRSLFTAPGCGEILDTRADDSSLVLLLGAPPLGDAEAVQNARRASADRDAFILPAAEVTMATFHGRRWALESFQAAPGSTWSSVRLAGDVPVGMVGREGRAEHLARGRLGAPAELLSTVDAALGEGERGPWATSGDWIVASTAPDWSDQDAPTRLVRARLDGRDQTTTTVTGAVWSLDATSDGTVWMVAGGALWRWTDGAPTPIAVAPFHHGDANVTGVRVGSGAVVLDRGVLSDVLSADGKLDAREPDVRWTSIGPDAAWAASPYGDGDLRLTQWAPLPAAPGWMGKVPPLALPPAARPPAPATEIYGRVLASGEPVAGANVDAVYLGGSATTTTDAWGRYTLRGLARSAVLVKANAPSGGASLEVDLGSDRRSIERDLTLGADTACTVPVVDAAGAPLQVQKAVLLRRGFAEPLEVTAAGLRVRMFTERESANVLVDGRKGSIELGPQCPDEDCDQEPQPACPAQVRLDGPVALRFRLLDATGAPVWPAEVSARGGNPPAHTSPDGTVRLWGVPGADGALAVDVRWPDGARGLARGVNGADLVVSKGTRIEVPPEPGTLYFTDGSDRFTSLSAPGTPTISVPWLVTPPRDLVFVGEHWYAGGDPQAGPDGVVRPAWRLVETAPHLLTDTAGHPLVGAPLPWAISAPVPSLRTDAHGMIAMPVAEDAVVSRLVRTEVPAWDKVTLDPLDIDPLVGDARLDAFVGVWAADPAPESEELSGNPVASPPPTVWEFRRGGTGLEVLRDGQPMRAVFRVGAEVRVDPPASTVTGDFRFLLAGPGEMVALAPDDWHLLKRLP